MQIEISQEQVNAAINEKINEAIVKAVGSYSVTEAIGSAVSEAIASGAVGDAINQAVGKMDTGMLVNSIAAEMERAVASGVGNMIREGVVEMCVNMRGVPDYDKEARSQARSEVIAQMK